jgi:hypothetical protein
MRPRECQKLWLEIKAIPPQIKNPIRILSIFFIAKEYAIMAPLLKTKLKTILKSLALGVEPNMWTSTYSKAHMKVTIGLDNTPKI